MSVAKKAVDSTIRKILSYAAEIILSMILLVIICLPLVLVIPMWLEHVLLGVPRGSLFIDPLKWFGLDGALWFTCLLGLVSITLGFMFVSRTESGFTDDEEEIESGDSILSSAPEDAEDAEELEEEVELEEEEEE